ncbi:MAG: potassium channel family protein [Planctomycetota bacterium]|jgi:hypothetical protein
MVFQRDQQNVTASELLQAIADGQQIQLSRCTVTGQLDVNRLFDPTEKFQTDELDSTGGEAARFIMLSQKLVFDKCVFEDNLVFTGPWSRPDSVTVEFVEEVVFNSSHFRAQARFRGAIFHKVASFDGCNFAGVTSFKNVTFRADAKFRTAHFGGYFLCGQALFESSARFTNCHFARGGSFMSVRFLGRIDFNGVYSSSRSVPTYEKIFFGRKKYGEDESFWRFVKQCAQEAGYYHLAGECFYNERCAGLWQKLRGLDYDSLSPIRRAARAVWAVRLLPEFLFGRLLFGYGERPTRVLAASAMIVIFCAFFFALPGALESRSADAGHPFMQGLYFSTITFTTLGYGDLYPAANGPWRTLAMAEAAAGACLIALFIVCLAKRFSRG